MEPVSVKSVDEHDFIWVYFGKFGIEVQYAPEDCNRHSGNDDSCAVCAEPDNEKRSKRRFWQTVQDDQIRLQDFRKLPEEPEKDGDKKAEEDYQNKTDQSFVKGYSDMAENTAVTGHFQKTQGNPGGAAEDEGVDESCICGKFPEEEKWQAGWRLWKRQRSVYVGAAYSGNVAGFLKVHSSGFSSFQIRLK